MTSADNVFGAGCVPTGDIVAAQRIAAEDRVAATSVEGLGSAEARFDRARPAHPGLSGAGFTAGCQFCYRCRQLGEAIWGLPRQ